MVTVYRPGATDEEAEMLTVEVQVGVEDGKQVDGWTETPAGFPETEKEIAWAGLLIKFAATVIWFEPPGATVTLGALESE